MPVGISRPPSLFLAPTATLGGCRNLGGNCGGRGSPSGLVCQTEYRPVTSAGGSPAFWTSAAISSRGTYQWTNRLPAGLLLTAASRCQGGIGASPEMRITRILAWSRVGTGGRYRAEAQPLFCRWLLASFSYTLRRCASSGRCHRYGWRRYGLGLQTAW